MGSRMKQARGAMALAEMKEFAGFSAGTQRYVRRALDIGLDREDALARWSRDVVEAASIRAQARLYDRLPDLRVMIPDDSGLDAVEPFMAPLVTMSAFDLGQGRLTSFPAYRFLYERLLGADARPWLPAAFCAAARSEEHTSELQSLMRISYAVFCLNKKKTYKINIVTEN